MIDFATIPASVRVPGSYIEFDSSRATAGLPIVTNRVLLLGQKLAAGTAVPGTIVRVFGPDDARQAFGRGSQLAQMAIALFANDPTSEVNAIAQGDPAGATPASARIEIEGAATRAGTLAVLIGGVSVGVGVRTGQSDLSTAAALSAAINANPDLPLSSSANGGTVQLLARHAGAVGNLIDIRMRNRPDDLLPPGLQVRLFGMAGGEGSPDPEAAWTLIGDLPVRTVVLATADEGILIPAERELEDRWGPTRMIETVAYAARPGTVGELTAFGRSRNSQLVSVVDAGRSPSPPWVIAAAYAGVAGSQSAIDPARPLRTLPLRGVEAPKEADRRTRRDREALLADGISTVEVGPGGVVQFERAITMYRVNALGFADQAYLDLATVLTLGAVRQAVRSRIGLKFPRHKLANDGTAYAPGAAVVTPSVLRAELIALMRELEDRGLVEGLDQFVADLRVERDPDDPNRVNALIPPDLVNGFRVFAAKVEFRR